MKFACQFAQRLAAMAAAIFFLGVQFGRCAPGVRNEEQRVVAEAALSSALAQYPAAPLPFRDYGFGLTGLHETHDAVERGSAGLPGNPGELGQ